MIIMKILVVIFCHCKIYIIQIVGHNCVILIIKIKLNTKQLLFFISIVFQKKVFQISV